MFFRCLSLCFFGGSVVVLGLYFFGLVVFFRVGSFGFLVELFLGFFASLLWVITSLLCAFRFFLAPGLFWDFCGEGF